jgi:hypothetical protein
MLARRHVRSCVLAALVAGAALGRLAHADGPEPCNAAYEKADLMLHASHSDALLDIRKELRACASPSCKAWMTKDCAQWLGEVEQRIPTVVLEAKGPDGRDVTDVTVTVDGAPIATQIDGAAIEMNPGPRTFVFTAADGSHAEVHALVREGTKAQPVTAVFTKTAEPPGPGPAPVGSTVAPAATGGLTSALAEGEPSHRAPLRTVGWAVGGVGVAGLVVGSIFGAVAISKNNESKANAHCDANNLCDAAGKSLRDDALNAATASTAAFIAGGVLVAVGVVLVIAAPHGDSGSHGAAARLEITPAVGPGSAGLALGGTF